MRHLRFRTRASAPTPVPAATPSERLWTELADYFEDENDDVIHATPDIGLVGVDPKALERIWDRLRKGADRLDPTRMVWDETVDAEVRAVDLLQDGVAAATARCPSILVSLEGICVAGVRLPFLGIFLYPDGIDLYWWIGRGDAWNGETVAAFAELLGELRELAPGAARESEHAEYGERFWRAVDAYLAEPGGS